VASASLGAGGKRVTLTTSQQQMGTSYVVNVSNVTDATSQKSKIAAAQLPYFSNFFVNSGFEIPTIASGQWPWYDAPSGIAGQGWTFVYPSGVATNNVLGNANAPEGAQAAFVGNGGSISQSIQLTAGTYKVVFMAAARAAGNGSFIVLFDGQAIDTITPPNSGKYIAYATGAIDVPAGTHTFTFSGNSGDSPFIDDVSLEIVTPVHVDVAGKTFIASAVAYPNPFNPSVTFDCYSVKGMKVSVRIFDVAGKCVSMLESASKKPGMHRLVWNGKDTKGKTGASGVYIARVSVDGKGFVRKLMMTR
jgi:hypothetical protein